MMIYKVYDGYFNDGELYLAPYYEKYYVSKILAEKDLHTLYEKNLNCTAKIEEIKTED